MFETLKRLYKEGRLSDEQIELAIFKYKLTDEQKSEIMSK